MTKLINQSFQQVKAILKEAQSKPLGYYDRRKPVIVQADASLRGLEACLIQDNRPITFASKSLTGVESRYANIERELLTIVFTCIGFNTYLQGRHLMVESDYKPLEMIHLKSMHNAPLCLQRMLLQLQKYDMTRCSARANQQIKLDLQVDYIAFTLAWIEKIRETTSDDPVLGTVYQLVQHRWLKLRRKVPNVARYFWDFRDELTTDEVLLLKGPSLVIPAVLRESYLQHLHKGHFSASKVKDKDNARMHMFWPGIDADINDYTRGCQICIERSHSIRKPLQPHDIPDRPWQKIGMDYFDYKGKSYILICDYFFKFPYMYQCKNSWACLSAHLIELFANERYPREIVSDNGSLLAALPHFSPATVSSIQHLHLTTHRAMASSSNRSRQ